MIIENALKTSERDVVLNISIFLIIIKRYNFFCIVLTLYIKKKFSGHPGLNVEKDVSRYV